MLNKGLAGGDDKQRSTGLKEEYSAKTLPIMTSGLTHLAESRSHRRDTKLN